MKCFILLLTEFLLLAIVLADSSADFTPVKLKVEYLLNPLSVETFRPRLSWQLETQDKSKKNLTQRAYQIIVATDEQKAAKDVGDLWDSSKVLSDSNTHITYGGKKLVSGQTAYWKVRAWDQSDRPTEYSSVGTWAQGLQLSDWTAQWIGAPNGTQQKALHNLSDIDAKVFEKYPGLLPVLHLRKQFKLDGTVKSAKLYATVKGVYKAMVNGKSFQDQELSPGWTDYNQTIEYQTYDLTELVQTGQNVLTVLLGTGWYSGYVGFLGRQYYHYGSDQSLLAELHIEYQNGTRTVVTTDQTWKVTTGPIIYSDMQKGELYYSDRQLKGWHSTNYDDKNWLSVVTKPIDKSVRLLAQMMQPIRVVQTLRPKSKNQVKPGVWVLDFEQNMVGWVQLNLTGLTGRSMRIQVRHGEVINPDGTLYTANLKTAISVDTYAINNIADLEDSLIEPHFTYHGFRYIEITGYPGEPSLEALIGKVVNSDTPFGGHIDTSSKVVNQLQSNIVWTQRGNFRSVPLGCPQRDERLGWSADAQIFSLTSAYNADVVSFFTKWFRDFREGQSPEGAYPETIPRLPGSHYADGAPAWGDAGVTIPYIMYKMYGETQLVADHYQSMQKWIQFIWSANPGLIWTKRVTNNFGDWLSVGANTPKDLLATAYFAYDSLLMSRMAAAINKPDDAKKYQSLYANISETFNKAYVDQTSGKVKGETQTCYCLALAFGLLPEKLRPLAAQHLADDVKTHDWHLTTGFVGIDLLLPTLTEYGHNDVAYRLLLQESYPSWGYEVLHNGTTIWERWDGWRDGKLNDPNMNSFSHFTFGSVGRWLFQSVGGIDQIPQSTGFRHILIKPKPGTGLSFANASYESVSGLITSSWTLSGDTFKLKTSIPVNTRATIDLTFSSSGAVHEVGSGVYEFEVKVN